MYTIQDSAQIEDERRPITVLVEDTASKAVNISSIRANHFEHFLQTALLPPSESRNPAARAGRWVARPIYVLVEGVTVPDSARGFILKAAMLSTRGGEASASANMATSKLFLQLEYTPTSFFDDLTVRLSVLDQYLDAVLPKSSTRTDLSLDITSIDWRSLLAVPMHVPQLPKWGSRNTAWCLIKMLKAGGLV